MVTPTVMPLLKLKDTFSSYQEFRNVLEKYERINRVQFSIRDAKRLHRAPSSVYDIVKDHPELEYHSFKLSCIHGGKPYHQKNKMFVKSFRKSKGTFKQDCEAVIFVKLNASKDRLMISKLCEEHNHDIPPSEGVFKHLPKLRRISENNRMDRRKLFTNKLERRDREEKGICIENVITVKDLRILKKIAELLRQKYSCFVYLQKDENSKIYGFFFQDGYMEEYFKNYPEILLVDGTYTLQNIPCSVYILSVENSVGKCDIVGVTVLTARDKNSVDWLFERFKERNRHYEDTTILLTHGQSAEYKVPKHFPNAKNLICLSHCLHTFRQDVQQRKKLGIMPSNVEEALVFFEKLMDAECDDEYTSVLEDMEDSLPLSLNTYYYKKWHDLRYCWVRSFSHIRTFLENQLDHVTSNFREKIASCKTFKSFVEKLYFFVSLQRKELKHQFFETALKFFTLQTSTPAEKKYDKFLTPYAFNKVKIRLSLAETSASTFIFTENGDDVICETQNDSFLVSKLSCSCDFSVLMGLPCEHVLAYRKVQQLDLFDEYLFSARWTRKYMGRFLEREFAGLPTEVTEESYEAKFAEAESVCRKLAALCSESSGSEFRDKIDFLRNLHTNWEITTKKEENVEDVEMDDACKSENIISEDIS